MEQNFFGPIFFLRPKIVFEIFLSSKFLLEPKLFLTQNFFGPRSFWTQDFLDPNFLLTQKKNFNPKFFLVQNFFRTQNLFFTQIFLGSHFFEGSKFLWTSISLGPKKISRPRTQNFCRLEIQIFFSLLILCYIVTTLSHYIDVSMVFQKKMFFWNQQKDVPNLRFCKVKKTCQDCSSFCL